MVFTPEMRALAIARLELENDLRYALRRNQLEVYYQPILSLEDERIKGFEALLRWNQPEPGDHRERGHGKLRANENSAQPAAFDRSKAAY